jgi:periplasmic copper chaperone A
MHRSRFRTAFLCSALLALALAPPARAQEHPPQIHAHDVYARVSGTGSGAVFFLVHNNGTTDDRLVAVRTEVAARAELHTTLMTADGVMQMRQIEGGVPLAAGEAHDFARGGDHVMLMGLTGDLADGATFPLTLVFESGAEVTLDVVVENDRKAGTSGHGH